MIALAHRVDPARVGMTSPSLLCADLGASRLLAHQGGRRLYLLDPPAALLWDLHASGQQPAALANLVAAHFGLALETAHTQVLGLIAGWRQAGLLAGSTIPSDFQSRATVAASTTPVPPERGAHAWQLTVADRAIRLSCEAPAFANNLDIWLGPLGVGMGAPHAATHCLDLRGNPSAWRLDLDGMQRAAGQTHDEALVATIQALVDMSCRPDERLLVLHGAGLVDPQGRGLLLVAPGGSGKSTLTAALNTLGWSLLSDDVVPVTPDGDLLGLGLPLCLKAGSWSVLADYRPDLAQAPTLQRYGQAVRFLPPRGRPVTGPVPASLLLFPRFDPQAAPQLESLTPEQALQEIITAEAVIRDLNQAKLEGLARWVEALPAVRVRYKDLNAALAALRTLVPTAPPA